MRMPKMVQGFTNGFLAELPGVTFRRQLNPLKSNFLTRRPKVNIGAGIGAMVALVAINAASEQIAYGLRYIMAWAGSRSARTAIRRQRREEEAAEGLGAARSERQG